MYIKVVIPTILLAYNPLKILTCKNTKKLIHRQKIRFAVCESRKSQIANHKPKKGRRSLSALNANPCPAGIPRGDWGYFLTNAFVTTPLSVVTRTKYMPAARPETLIWIGDWADAGESADAMNRVPTVVIILP